MDVVKKKTQCNKCLKPMNVKTARYVHENVCTGKPESILDKPVKRRTPKITVKPIENQSFSTVKEDIQPQQQPIQQQQQPVRQQKPINPYENLSSAQLMQLQMRAMNTEIIRRKQEKANVLCKSMFTTRSKKSK